VALIYFVYKAMLSADNDSGTDDLQATSNEILAQIKNLYKQKKYNIVESMAKKYLDTKYSDVDVRNILAKALHDCGRLNEAVDQAKIILKFQPKNYDMRIFIANCHIDSSRMSKAILVLQEVLAADENNVVAIKMLAKIYFDTNQKHLAIKMFEKLEEFLYSNSEKAINKKKLAFLHIDFKEYEAAIAEYNGVLELYPAEVEVRKSLIAVYKMTSDYEALIEMAEEILSLDAGDENDLWAIKILIDSYLDKSDCEKALEFANKLKEHPESNKAEASEYIAKIFMVNGRIDDGIDILTALIDENEGDVKLKKTLAKSYESKQDFSLAADMYKKILDEVGASEINEIHLEMSNLYAKWGEFLFAQGDNDGCFKCFATAIRYYSENSEIYYLLGTVNQSIKSFNEAISQFKKAIELDSENSRYYFSIAECYAEIDNFYDEKRALLECIRLNPNNAKAQYRLAILFESQHESKSAIEYLRKTIKLDDNFIDAKYKLALLLEVQGHKDESIDLYKSILLSNPEHEGATNNLSMLSA
jgi:tetratricopeptide (TPR) repeat protein